MDPMQKREDAVTITLSNVDRSAPGTRKRTSLSEAEGGGYKEPSRTIFRFACFDMGEEKNKLRIMR